MFFTALICLAEKQLICRVIQDIEVLLWGKKRGGTGQGRISTSSVDGQQKPEVKRRELCSRNAREVRLSTHSWLKGQLYDVLDLSFIH